VVIKEEMELVFVDEPVAVFDVRNEAHVHELEFALAFVKELHKVGSIQLLKVSDGREGPLACVVVLDKPGKGFVGWESVCTDISVHPGIGFFTWVFTRPSKSAG